MTPFHHFTLLSQNVANKRSLSLALIALASVTSSDAATINWGTPQTISTAAVDVETDGILILAIDADTVSSGTTTVTGKNGIAVDFQMLDTTGADALSNFETKFGNTASFGGGSSDYGALVNDGWWHGSASDDALTAAFSTDTVVLSELLVGQEYVIQYWAQDADRNPTFLTILDGSTNLELDTNADNAIDYGQFVVGTFTADATTQSFSVSGTLDGNNNYGRAQLNAFQLRNINNAFIGWQIEAENYDAQSGTQLETTSDTDGGQNVAYISNGDWLRFDNLSLGDNALLNFRVARNSGADASHIEVRQGSTTGTLLAQIDVPETGGWQTWETISIQAASVVGQQDIYLVFVETSTANGGSLFNLNWWSKTPMVEAEDYTAAQGQRFENTQDIGGGQNLGWITDGEWIEYTIEPQVAGWHKFDFRVAGNNSDGSINIVSGGQTIGTVEIGNTGGWQSWGIVSTYVNLPSAGTQTLRLEFVVPSAGFNVNWFSYEPSPAPLPLTIGNTEQQKMRYGMDYERLWYWTSSLNSSERNDVARWSVVDADVDFVRVAMNSGYELTENSFDLSKYTNKIIPVMQEMQEANPNIKFFASPRPLNEAVSGATWQPYPLWVTGATTYTSGDYDFDYLKCSEYIVKYLILMKSYGFKISFIDITNEWQSNVAGGRVTQDDMDNIHEYLHVTYMAAPWEHPSGLYAGITLTADDIPEIIAPSSWSLEQGTTWINNLDAGDKEAISIAASHNTDRAGSAQLFADAAKAALGNNVEIWNTETHGWKSTSSTNETTSFYYYLEAIRAGFGGINGWLAIGTTNQGHAYILNPSGTPTRNVKYHIFQKLSSTSNYGHALDIIEEPGLDVLNAPLGANDDDIPRNVAAFIKGNLMTVWVINENTTTVPLVIAPSGYTIATSTVRRTRWTDPSNVEGFETLIPITSNTSFTTDIPGESVCCFEITLNTETFANEFIDPKDFSHQWGTYIEDNANENLADISNGDWARYGSVALAEDSTLAFSVARPNGRPDGIIRVREGNSEGPILGEVAVPVTGNWQNYQTIRTKLDVEAGIYNLYLEFVEDVTTTGSAMFNLDGIEVQVAETPVNFSSSTTIASQVDFSWDAVPGAIGYTVKRSTTQGGPYTVIDDTITATTYSDTSASAGTTYYYVVIARFDGFEGEQSTEITATALTPIEAWRQESFGDPANTGNGADMANPDTDSLVNLLEFAFGTDPNVNDAVALTVNEVGGTFTLGTPVVDIDFSPLSVQARFIRRVDHASSGITYTAQFSNELSTWEDVDGSTAVQINGVLESNGYEAVELSYPTFLSTGRKARFFRVQINETASGDTQPE
ncbi:MAG: carbohydrate-binding protein [Opitutaceae bacterium]